MVILLVNAGLSEAYFYEDNFDDSSTWSNWTPLSDGRWEFGLSSAMPQHPDGTNNYVLRGWQ